MNYATRTASDSSLDHDTIEYAYYAGDRELIQQVISGWLNLHECQRPSPREVHVALETCLSIEDMDLSRLVFSRCKEWQLPIPLLSAFRLAQTNKDISCYEILGSAFDRIDQVLDTLESLNSFGGAITVYDLGGLGDYIENLAIIERLLIEHYINVRCVIRIPAGLESLLSRVTLCERITYLPCSWQNRQKEDAFHMITITAIATRLYGITPKASGIKCTLSDSRSSSDYIIEQYHKSGRNKLCIWNPHSQAKLLDKELRKSYFLRSVSHQHWKKMHDLLSSDYYIVDVSEYRAGFPVFSRMQSSYINVPATAIGFTGLASLTLNADRVITCDSMLVHLCAYLNISCELLLAIGHDQRWFLHFSNKSNMYSESVAIFKQSIMHDWGSICMINSL